MRYAVIAFLLATIPVAAQDIHSSEAITVERIIVDARVTDDKGDPILGLGRRDLFVKIDGIPAVVEAVDWIPENAATRARTVAAETAPVAGAAAPAAPSAAAPEGRLIVVFFQTDFARNPSRLKGQMKILWYANRFIDSLEPNDRVAVLSYDSHLKFRLDFSTDRAAARQAMGNALAIDDPPPPPAEPAPRIADFVTAAQLRDTSNPEKGFIRLAEALRAIPGAKSMVLFGWGLGYIWNGRPFMSPDYAAARAALQAARVTCFSIDVTQASEHPLAAGLIRTARDTGGFYATTAEYPQRVFDYLERALAGHYELEVRKPALPKRGVHSIEVLVTRAHAKVLARTNYTDTPDPEAAQ